MFFHYTRTFLHASSFPWDSSICQYINQSLQVNQREPLPVFSFTFVSIYLRLPRLRTDFILQSHPNATLSQARDSPSLEASRKERVTQAQTKLVVLLFLFMSVVNGTVSSIQCISERKLKHRWSYQYLIVSLGRKGSTYELEGTEMLQRL